MQSLARLEALVRNLAIIDPRNAAETGSATHGITKFADLSAAEIRAEQMAGCPPLEAALATLRSFLLPSRIASLGSCGQDLVNDAAPRGRLLATPHRHMLGPRARSADIVRAGTCGWSAMKRAHT